jgi:hypothetical protein
MRRAELLKPAKFHQRERTSQSKKFIEAAREISCNEDESTFDDIVKKVAKSAATSAGS